MSNMNNSLDGNGLLYFWQKLKTMFAGKVDKVDGKGLSTNDYTTGEKTKLSGIETGANKTTVENSLTSTNTANALSANQGKVLDEKIKALSDSMSALGYGDMMKSVYDSNGDGTVDKAATANDASKLGGKSPSYYAAATSIPTTVAQLTDAGNYALKSDLTNVYKYKGSKATYADLPTSGNVAGDVWSVEGDKGMNYGWTGSTWDPLGEVFSITYISNAEIDEILAT